MKLEYGHRCDRCGLADGRPMIKEVADEQPPIVWVHAECEDDWLQDIADNGEDYTSKGDSRPWNEELDADADSTSWLVLP
jgi:hypothetical protein